MSTLGEPDGETAGSTGRRDQSNAGDVRLYLIAMVAVLLIVTLQIGSSVYILINLNQPHQLSATGSLGVAASAPVSFAELPGLSPAIRACYEVNFVGTSILMATALGAAIGICYIFGTFLYKKFRDSNLAERQMFWGHIAQSVARNGGGDITEVMNGFRHYETVILDRRNIYWGLFLRATLALVVVGAIAILIASCKVEAQAGLPIITGIISFIIGQGAEAIHGGSQVLVVSDRRPGPNSDPMTPAKPDK